MKLRHGRKKKERKIMTVTMEYERKEVREREVNEERRKENWNCVLLRNSVIY
jgi:hypothetical protein